MLAAGPAAATDLDTDLHMAMCAHEAMCAEPPAASMGLREAATAAWAGLDTNQVPGAAAASAALAAAEKEKDGLRRRLLDEARGLEEERLARVVLARAEAAERLAAKVAEAERAAEQLLVDEELEKTALAAKGAAKSAPGSGKKNKKKARGNNRAAPQQRSPPPPPPLPPPPPPPADSSQTTIPNFVLHRNGLLPAHRVRRGGPAAVRGAASEIPRKTGATGAPKGHAYNPAHAGANRGAVRGCFRTRHLHRDGRERQPSGRKISHVISSGTLAKQQVIEWTGDSLPVAGVEETDACMALILNSSQRSLLQGHEVLVYYYRWLQHFPGSESDGTGTTCCRA